MYVLLVEYAGLGSRGKMIAVQAHDAASTSIV